MRVDEKPLIWLGSSRKDLLAMPRAVQREFGFALHLAQIGTKHPGAKVLRGSVGRRAGSRRELRDQYLLACLYRALFPSRLCPSLLQEEISKRHRNDEAGYGVDPQTA
jgi:phage-related protein